MTAWVLLLFFAGCSNGNDSDQIPLIASIYVTNQHLVLQNGDPVVWRNVTVTIDEKYTFKAEYIPRGNESIAFEKFVDEDGLAFQPGLLKFRKLTVRVPRFSDGKDGIFTW